MIHRRPREQVIAAPAAVSGATSRGLDWRPWRTFAHQRVASKYLRQLALPSRLTSSKLRSVMRHGQINAAREDGVAIR